MKTITPNLRIVLLFIIPVGLLLSLIAPLAKPEFGRADFIGYWSTVRLILQGENPYDAARLGEFQHANNPFQEPEHTVFAWNPPWLIALLIPYGLMPFPIATSLWVLTNLILLGTATLLSWHFVARPDQTRSMVWILAASFLFAQSLVLIQIGQITTLVLVSWLICLRLLEMRRDFLAGAVLLMTAIKPHVVYLAIFILLIWVIRRRRWGVFWGLGIAAITSLVLIWVVLPGWLNDYLQTLGSLPYSALYTSTIGSFMSAMLGTEIFRYSAVLLIFLIPFLLKLAEKDLFTSMNFAFLVCVPLSPYGFSFDQVVFLPAIAQLIHWLYYAQIPRRIVWLIGGGLVATYLINLWMVSLDDLPYHWLAWIPIVLTIWFTWAYFTRHEPNH